MTTRTETNDSLVPAATYPVAGHDSDSIKLLKTGFLSADSLKPVVHKQIVVTGLEGTSTPYRLNADDGVSGVLFFCFFITAYVLSQGKRFLFQKIKDFLHTKERVSIFAETTAAEFRYKLLLLFQACILFGSCFYVWFHESTPALFQQGYTLLLLSVYIAACTLCLVLQWQLYRFIGWVFFDKNKTRIWLESYAVILYYLGFLLFPVVLLSIYFHLSAHVMIIYAVVLVIFAKILMFYKWLKLFFSNVYGVLYLIVYFCALELVPALLLYQVLVQINNLLLLKQ